MPTFTYGFFQITARVPKAQGLWPAIWLLPFSSVASNDVQSRYGGWAACGEIDIMETVNTNPAWFGTLHFGGEWPNNVQVSMRSHAPATHSPNNNN